MTGKDFRDLFVEGSVHFLSELEMAQLACALDDRNRLEWLSSHMNIGRDGQPSSFLGSRAFQALVNTTPMGEHPCLRAAIDAEMGEG